MPLVLPFRPSCVSVKINHFLTQKQTPPPHHFYYSFVYFFPRRTSECLRAIVILRYLFFFVLHCWIYNFGRGVLYTFLLVYSSKIVFITFVFFKRVLFDFHAKIIALTKLVFAYPLRDLHIFIHQFLDKYSKILIAKTSTEIETTVKS